MLPNPHFPADLVTFTEEILNGKVHFCGVQPQKLNLKIFNYLLPQCKIIISNVANRVDDGKASLRVKNLNNQFSRP